MRRVFNESGALVFAAVCACAVALASCEAPRSYHGYKYKPYSVRGVRFDPIEPAAALGYVEAGIASHYREGGWFFPGETSLGERFRGGALEGAHKTLPLPCTVEVVNLRNQRRAVLRLNDRGPFVRSRILDVTPAAARKLGFYEAGLAPVQLRVLSVGDGPYCIQ